ncbi:MAG: hypothetical protein NZ849_06425 [Meiothermus sp.]|uniref:HD domain-containing protein n=1 Tax=Meiothermus sp. TaxID=1955249 RepID=UPI0025EEDCCA|nr:hypothetical protein [Meiothermus sp.]MCS7194534.1 hypothetical protein [Meiothermus sp.]MCX7740494.1 hypothetical protein [Meiothermus sp.]MDW8091890.1 hypothetical protein [Meiothermus sp.]MDW8480867.1 hypothetical protein [Meiothermus sp.]
MSVFRLSPGGRKRLLARWDALWLLLGQGSSQQAALLDELLTRYAEPQRYYHNLAHLEHLLGLLPQDPRLELAAWFHDAVYDPTRTDNEEESARLAQKRLAALGLSQELIGEVLRIVRATRTHRAEDPLTALFLDADLAILGADPKTYARYAQAIRKEYSWLPEVVFRQRRAELLRDFLSRPRIYQTKRFAGLEGAARQNLAWELQGLWGSEA